MDEQPERVILERAENKIEAVANVITLAMSAAATWYALDPEGFSRACGKITNLWNKLQFKVSVWKAQEAIQSLPTTDITDITPSREGSEE